MPEWNAFWSYAHVDDRHDQNRVLRLRKDLSDRMHLRTGESFEIFADRTGLQWGADWEATIDDALLRTAFFIPIVTPCFLKSTECRRELKRFADSAEAVGLTELILPIYYVTCERLEPSSNAERAPVEDDVVELILKYQWQDFRIPALENRSSARYRQAVDHLAEELMRRTAEADAKPTSPPVLPPAPIAGDDQQGGTGGESSAAYEAETPEAAGGGDEDILDRLAEAEEAFPRLALTTSAIGNVIERVGNDAAVATAELGRSDALGRGMAGRLTASRNFASKMTDAADELEPLVRTFLADLRIIDPTTRLLLRLVRESGETQDASEYLDAIRGMAAAAIPSLDQMLELANTILANARWSKALKEPSRRIGNALRQLADARSMFADWIELIDELRSVDSPAK
jgi:hypothetical protein